MIMPAHDPYAGIPPPIRLRIGSASPNSTDSLLMVVDSPPGMTSASTSSSSPGRRTGRATTSHSARAYRCSRTSPCRASTPTTSWLTEWSPAALGQPVGLRDVVDVDADHGLAEPTGDLGDHVGVVVEGGGLDDGGGPL